MEKFNEILRYSIVSFAYMQKLNKQLTDEEIAHVSTLSPEEINKICDDMIAEIKEVTGEDILVDSF